MPNSGCAQDLANAPGTCIPQNMISQQSLSLLNFIPLPNVPCPTPATCPALNFHLQANLPSLSQRLNVNVTHQISVETQSGSELQPHQWNFTFSEQFPGHRGKHVHARAKLDDRPDAKLDEDLLHTSQLYFSRTRTLGLNEFSNLTGHQFPTHGIAGDFDLTDFSTMVCLSINLTDFTGLSSPNPSLSYRSQTYRWLWTAPNG